MRVRTLKNEELITLTLLNHRERHNNIRHVVKVGDPNWLYQHVCQNKKYLHGSRWLIYFIGLSIVCPTVKPTMMSVCIPEFCYCVHNLCAFSHVQKGILSMTCKGSVNSTAAKPRHWAIFDPVAMCKTALILGSAQ